MIETLASKSCSAAALSAHKRDHSSERVETATERRRYNPLVWLNLVCLDAPIVAISWMFLFARSFGIPMTHGGTAALFLTAWFIYLADRFGDNLSLDQNAAASLRQRFCRRHQILWLTTLLLVGVADVVVAFTLFDSRTRIMGIAIGAFALVYLLVNQTRPALWCLLPVKELSIGFLFAAGAMVPLAHGLTSAVAPAWLCFAALCSLNCISIAIWERELDLAQHRVSVATTFPSISRVLVPMTIVLCLTSCAFGVREIAISAALLAAVHIFRNKLQPDVRTALADLVLLTPIVRLLL